MALDYLTLKLKQIVSRIPSGESVAQECYDLASPTFIGTGEYSLDYLLKSGILKTVTVNHYYTARPDLISLAVYGTDIYGDIICKINGISNPFDLMDGMVLYVPKIGYIEGFVKQGEECPLCDDDSIIGNTKSADYRALKNTRRDTNVQKTDEKNYTIDTKRNLVCY